MLSHFRESKGSWAAAGVRQGSVDACSIAGLAGSALLKETFLVYDATLRSPQEIFACHGNALESGDPEAIAANFAEDAMLITPWGVRQGREGVREIFTQFFADLPRAKWDLSAQTFAEDILLLEWSAGSERNRVARGVDVFIFRNGMIQAQTIRYTLMANG